MNSSSPLKPSFKILLTNFEWTIDRFEEILQNDKTDYFRDAALQRFTFACDMAFKCLTSLAIDKETTCQNFRECLEWAEENNLLGKDTPWKELAESYDRAVQKLKGESADQEFAKLEAHCLLLKTVYSQLKSL